MTMTLKTRTSALLFLLLLGVGSVYYYFSKAAPSHAVATEMIAYTDLAGRKVIIKKDVKRIILLRSKDIYGLAVLLGDQLPKKLIAWGPDLETDDKETYDKFIAKYPSLKKLPKNGSIYSNDMSIEQLLTLKPDLVIADKFMIDRGYKYIEQLEEAGLPLIYLDGSNDPLSGSQKGITLLGNILGKQKKANEIVSYVNAQLDAVLHIIDHDKPVSPSVYLEAGMGGPEKFGQTYGSAGIPKTYTSWGAVLNRLKVNNIADGIVSQMGGINPEFILKANPDVIIITGQNWNTSANAMRLGYYVKPEQARKLLNNFSLRPGWSGLSAVKNKRLYSVFHNSAAITCFASVQALAKCIYPSSFTNLHPEENLETFYKKFMPVAYSGVWMTDLQ